MLRRLFDLFRHWLLMLRHAGYALRGWAGEWFYVLSTPVRAFRPRQWAGTLSAGLREVVGLARTVRPRGLGSELATGGREAVGIARGAAAGAVATVVAFFWLLIWLPVILARAGYRSLLWTWYVLRTRTKRQLLWIAVAAAIILGGGVGAPAYVLLEHRRAVRIGIYRQQYDFYVVGSDVDKLEDALANLAAELPDDPDLARRLAMVRAREAPVSEPKLVRFFMRHHLVNGRLDESVREANKLLESLPDDWEARCYLAKVALNRGDPDGARKQLADLPPTGAAGDSIPAYVAVDAYFLFRQLKLRQREEDVVEFVTLRILPELRSKEMVHLPTMSKLFLIQCYYVALSQIDRRPQLTKYWDPVQRACQSIMDDPATPVPTLVTIGEAQDNNLRCLNDFVRRKLVSANEFNEMALDLLGRQKALWEDVLRRDPHNVRAFVGLAEYHYITRAPDEAERVAARGLQECGPAPDLVYYTTDLLRRTDPRRGLEFLEKALRPETMTPRMCVMYEQVATAAGRPDKALAACRKALEQDPKQTWARLREAAICLTLDRPTDAAAALRPIADELPQHPDGCENYVKALCGCGAYHLAEEFLERVAAADCPVDVLLKAAEGLQAAGRHADAVRWARRVTDKDKLNVKALLIQADSTRILADKGEQGWDRDLVREALRAYKAVERQQPDDLKVVNNIAWLELKALGLPREAYASAARLRAAQNQVGLPAEFHETLGAVYLGVGQYDAAVQMLRQAVATAGPRPSFYTYLALAYHGLGQPEKAEQYLSQAAGMPKSAKELAEVREAARVIYGR